MAASSSAPVSAIGSVSFGWLHEQAGFCFDEAYFLDPERHLRQEAEIHAFVAERFPDDPVYNMEAHLGQVEYRQRPVALVGAIQPNLLLGAALGARFVFYGDKDPDITQAPLAHVQQLDDLPSIDWPHTWPIQLLLEQVHGLQAQRGQQRVVVPPFFWDTSGRATIHGVLTTAQKLLGERIFTEVIDRPEFVRGVFQWITDGYTQLIDLFARAAAMNITGLHIGDCSLCTVSPRVFRELVLPSVNEMAQRFGAVRMHSCGRSDHLLESFQQIERLGSVNVGSNTSVTRVREQFPTLPLDLIPDTCLLTDGTPDDVDAWVRQCLRDNGAAPMQFQYHLERDDAVVNCLQIHRTLRSLGLTTARAAIH